MYIKVAVEGHDPVIYRLEQAEVLIGSGQICHIIIRHPSISKKHIKILRDDASWYAVDQGSTNGSYCDEDQLVPGNKTNIPLETELRLGDKVFLSLVKIAENAIELNKPIELEVPIQKAISSDQDKTRVISMNDLKKAKATIVKKKQREIKKVKIQEKKGKQSDSKKKSNLLLSIFLLMFGGYVGSNYWNKHKNDFIKKESVVKKVATKYKGDDEIERDIEGFRIRRTTLLTRNFIIEHFNKYKECSQEEVREFCLNGVLTHGGNGAQFIKPGNYIFFIEETHLMPTIYATYLREPKISENMARSLILFGLIETDFRAEKFPPDANIYVALFKFDDLGVKRISTISAFKNSLLNQMNDSFKKMKPQSPDSDLEASLKVVENFYTIY